MSAILNSLQGLLGGAQNTFYNVLDRIFPPEQRSAMMAKLQAFAVNNPKLAAFLTTQIVISGLPLLLFLTFTVTVFLFSLVAALIIGLLAAVLFTVFCVGVALIVILPTVFMSIFGASFIFLWGLGGYYILKWFNEGDAPAEPGQAIGDKINNLTGGRMNWLMEGSRKKQDDKRTGVDQTPKVHGSESNGSVPDFKKNANDAKDQVTKQVDGVQKRVNKSTGGATNTVGNTAGTAKGVVGGATGLG